MPDDGEHTGRTRAEIAALASTVISVLSEKPVPHTRALRMSVVQKIVRACLRTGAFDAAALAADLVDERTTAEQIVDHYIAEAARSLGIMWEADTIGFADVTIGSARLQGLIATLACRWRPCDMAGPSVLFVSMKGDTHTLGAQIAVTQMRRAGADVHLLFGPDHTELLTAMARGNHDMVMFSCSRPDGLATIAHLVIRMRAGHIGTPPIALGGLVLHLTDRVKERTGVDVVTNDIRVAMRLCESSKPRAEIAMRR
jgi:methanogenic corrinoid protein MtbC1